MSVDDVRITEEEMAHAYTPGLRVAGKTVIRKNRILPLKGELELWYVRNMSFWLDMKIVLVTAFVVLFPNSKLYLKVFRDLPHGTYADGNK